MAITGALGHHFCGRLLRRYSSRLVIGGGAAVAAAGAALMSAAGAMAGFERAAIVAVMTVASLLLGLGIGAAMTASYSAAGAVIPPGAHGTGFGVLTSASLTGMAISPFVAGLLVGTSIRAVFFVNVAIMGASAIVVSRTMVEAA